MEVEGYTIEITNTNKVIWPKAGITKMEYIHYMSQMAPFILPYTKNRLLMMWRYPEGIHEKKIEEKAVPLHAPAWLPRAFYKDKDWILLNNIPALLWVSNYAAIELHVPFSYVDSIDYPTELVFDLDPPDDRQFDLVCEVSLLLRNALERLGLMSVAKTSGSTGMHLHVPIVPEFTFEETRKINRFVASYVKEILPEKITLERVIKKREGKLYFDYLQLWKLRTMPAPYTVRARDEATVATPVTWEEVEKGFSPLDFTIRTVPERVKRVGDIFSPITTIKQAQSLKEILSFLNKTKNI